MNLSEVKTRLEKENFFAALNKKEDEDTGITIFESGFTIKNEENKLKLEYAYGQISKSESFDSLEEMIDFVLQTFPIRGVANKE